MKRMKRNLSLFFVIATLLALLCSCASSRKILYLQDFKDQGEIEALHLYESTIKKDDLLEIVVSAPNKEVVMPYNLTLSENGNIMSTIPYLVDATGCIDFPVLGTIRVEGMTRHDLVEMLTQRIALDVKDPIVNISFANFRVTVLGEVRSPGTYTMVSDRTTIFQALSMAGDLGLTARRGNVLLVRETTDGYKYVRLDLRSSDLLTSPWYYMSQNDLVYVAPSRGRIQSGTASTTILSIISSALSLVSVGVALYLLL
jgi:polysaccharide export outer membrane protein